MIEQKSFLINFKETADVKDIVFVLNSLNMATSNVAFIEKLEKNDNIVLKEIDGKQVQKV